MVDPAPPEADPAVEHAAALLDAAGRALMTRAHRLEQAVATVSATDIRPLSDYERIAAHRTMQGLLRAAEADLRTLMALHPEFPELAELRHSFGSARVTIAENILSGAGLGFDRALVAAVLRHIEFGRLSRVLRGQAGGSDDDPFDSLLEHADAEVSSLAVAMLIAGGAHRESDDGAAMSESDLAPALRERLYWQVAAALRSYAVAIHGAEMAVIDRIAVEAVEAVLAGPKRPDATQAADMLARSLQKADAFDGLNLVDLALAGHVWLYAAMLARQSHIDVETVADLLAERNMALHALLLKTCEIDRDTAARLLLGFAQTGDMGANDHDIVSVMAAFDRIDATAARRALTPWLADPAYRDTITALSARPARIVV